MDAKEQFSVMDAMEELRNDPAVDLLNKYLDEKLEEIRKSIREEFQKNQEKLQTYKAGLKIDLEMTVKVFIDELEDKLSLDLVKAEENTKEELMQYLIAHIKKEQETRKGETDKLQHDRMAGAAGPSSVMGKRRKPREEFSEESGSDLEMELWGKTHKAKRQVIDIDSDDEQEETEMKATRRGRPIGAKNKTLSKRELEKRNQKLTKLVKKK